MTLWQGSLSLLASLFALSPNMPFSTFKTVLPLLRPIDEPPQDLLFSGVGETRNRLALVYSELRRFQRE